MTLVPRAHALRGRWGARRIRMGRATPEAVCLAAWVAACGGGEPRAWIARGSTADSLVFGLSASSEREDPLAVSSLQVHACVSILLARQGGGTPTRDSTLWYADRWPPDAPAPELDRLAYGRLPGGMQQDASAEPLRRPGCFVLSVVPAGQSGSAAPIRVGVRLEEDGSATELSPAQLDSILRPPAKPASGG